MPVLWRGMSVVATSAAVAALAACGSSSSSSSSSSSTGASDPVSTALQTPGVRTVLLAKQRSDITVIIPPCPRQGSSQQPGGQPNGGVGSATSTVTIPPGSSRIVVPKGALAQTVAVQPCQSQQSSSSSGEGSGPPGDEQERDRAPLHHPAAAVEQRRLSAVPRARAQVSAARAEA